MRRVLVVVGVVGLVACNKGAAPDGKTKADPQFDARWQQATASGEPMYIESQKGGGLMGEVRRAVEPAGGDGPIAAAIVQGPLPDPAVVSVIRRNLPAVKGCYEV